MLHVSVNKLSIEFFLNYTKLAMFVRLTGKNKINSTKNNPMEIEHLTICIIL